MFNHAQSPLLSSFFEKLEDRVLFDGVPDAAMILPEATNTEPAQFQNFQGVSSEQAQSGHQVELIIVDSGIENGQLLLDSLIASKPETSFEVRILDSNQDGVRQISQWLSARDNQFQAIHVLSHGAAGNVELGSSSLNLGNVSRYQDDLSSWASSLTEDADILFYGCELAGNQDGQELIEIVSRTTGADVAASTDLTGDSAENANWRLEFVSGYVETLALSSANWQGTLAIEATDGIATIQDAENSAAGTITLTNNGAPEVVTVLNTPTRVGQMLERVWQFNETADTGRATYVFDVSGVAGFNAMIASEFGLIISDQFDLADGPNTTTLVASGYDAANGLVYFHQVDLDPGDYFGLATEVVLDNFSIFPTATGLEDTPIDLGLVLSPSLTQGGQLQDIIATDTGFRASNAGTTSTDFFIPAGTTGIRITGYSTRDIGTAATDIYNDDYQFLNASIDLGTETSNGYIGHIIDQGPQRSDQFGWEEAPLGSAILTGGGTITGDADDNINPTFTIVDGVLQITENHQLQTAYHVEFLTNATSSSEFIRTESTVLESSDQSLAMLSVPANADFLVVNITDAAAGANFAIEYKGNSRVVIDLATLEASGVVSAQQGETDNRVVAYAFEDYDVSSASVGSILSAAGTVVGDTTGQASVVNDNQIYIDAAGDLIIDRNNSFASSFNSLITVEYYERRPFGSSADQQGESTEYGVWNSDPSNPTSTLEFDIPANATLGILNMTQNGTNPNDTNENSGAAFAVIDLVNGTSSGSIYFVRASNVVDLVGWDATAFGTAFFDDPNSISNHNSINQFNDPFAGTATFNLINGGTTLEMAVNSNSGGTGTFLDYNVGGQIQWYGAAPFEVSGSVAGGSFSQGTFNPVTGNHELTIAQASMGLSYIPPTHVSGNVPVDVTLRIGDESEVTAVTIQAVIDPITIGTVPDACGFEDTDISIAPNIMPMFVDQDGSETLTSLVLSNVPIGHTVSDGTNTFVSSAGNQSVDITAWNQATMVYRAMPNQSGTFTITIDADWQDVGGGVTDTDTIQTTFDIIVKPVNDPPVAVDDFYTVLGNTTLTTTAANGVLINDSDPESDPLTVNTTPVSGPSNGTLTLNANGTFTYTPTAGFSGTDSFVYEVSDGNGGVTTATAFIDVSVPVTGPLNAVNDAVMTNEETLINIVVMANDALPTTGAFNIQSTTPPSNGTITVLPNGTIDYTPNVDFFGVDTFTYTLADASGRTSTATVTVTVKNVQDPPVANADSGSTPEDTTLPNINILANDSDPDNDTLTVTSATPANGTVVINANGTIDYTPNPGFFGTDTVNYTITDGNGGFANSSVLINVVPVADPPTSADNSVTTVEEISYTFVASDFPFADQDPFDSLVAVRIDTLPAAGQLLINGNPATAGQVVSLSDINNGNLIFVPAPNGFGTNYTTFDFSVSDGLLFQTSPNTMTVHVTPVQDPPVATDNAITVNEESVANPLGLATPTDVDGDTLTATVTGLPTLGTVFLADGVTVVNNGDMLTMAQLTSLVYDAPTVFTVANAGSFTYDVTDGLATDSGQVDITILPVNDPPFVDLNGGAPGEDYADTFTEGGPPVNAFDNPGSGIADEDDTTLPFLKIDVDQSTIVDAGQEFLTIAGVDFQLDATANSTTTLLFGGLSIDVTYTAATGNFNFVRTDGAEMTPGQARLILLDATYRNDSVLPTVGGRDFDVCVNDGDTDSNIATSTITVVRDSETAEWSITGSAMVTDGSNATYVVELSDPLRVGETASVDLGLMDIDTNTSDHGALNTAIAAAVAAYSGPGTLAWNGTTLTFTSDGTGVMAPLSIVLPTTPDAVYEGDEDYKISLSNPASTTGETISIDPAADEVVTTIKDNNPPPTVTINDASATEGSPLKFTIALNRVSFEPITIDLSATSGSATAVTDFETTNFEYFDGTNWLPAAAGTQVTIPAGQTSLMVRVDSVQDGNVEPDETFTLSATVVSGAVASASDTGTGTIINDDVSLISINDVSVDEDNGTMTFTISLDQAPTGNVSVDWATANGSATGADYTAASGTANFAPGVQTQTVTIAITQDNLYEGPHAFNVNLSNASGGTIVDPTGVGTIFDDGNGPNGTDDDRPVISVNNVTSTEGTNTHGVFTISLSNPSIQNTDLSLALVNGWATSGADYGPGLEYFDGTAWQPVSGNITIAAGATSIQVRTPIIDDVIADNNETYSLVATRVNGTTFNSSATGTGTILDDADPTLVSISGPASVTEGTSAIYTVALGNTPITPVTLNFTYTGSASGGTDYSGVATITIPAGSTTGTVTIPTINDSLGEPLENFTITISSATGGSFENFQIDPTDFEVTTDIVDDDVPKISVNDVVVTEGVDGFAEFTVELSNPTYEIIDFSISATGVTASGDVVDYGIIGVNELEVFNGSIWVPATSASFAINNTTIRMRTPIFDDVLAEGVETFEVTVTTIGGTTCNLSDTGTGTIIEDMTDPETILVSLIGPPSVVEGATTTNYSLELTDPSGLPINAVQDVTVTLVYSGTAIDGSDYTSVATVLIPAGSPSATFTLPTVNDSLYEGTESIVVAIDSVTGGGFEGIAADPVVNTVTTLINDGNDIPTVAINNVTSIEGTDNFAFYTVSISNLSVEDIDIDLSLASGTATGAGVDFGSAGAGNLQLWDGTNWNDVTSATILAGTGFVQLRTPIIDDPIDEPTENYTLTVDVTAGTTTNIQVIGTGTIIDDDPAPDVTIADATANEGDPLVFNVMLSNPSSQPIVLDFAASDTTAAAATDYDATTFEYSTDGGTTWITATGGSQVTIPAGLTAVQVRVQTTEDLTLETTETMELSIASVVSGIVGNTTDTAVGTIIDDDTALVSIIANDPVAGEPTDHGQFTVTMSNPSDSPTVIAYSVAGSATNGTDFVALSGTITLPAGVTSDTIDITVIDDVIIEGIEDVTIKLTSIISGDAQISIDLANDTDTATIIDDDTATWQIVGDTTVNEGANAKYVVSLAGTLQAGETASIELHIGNVTAIMPDYANLVTAVNTAVSNYTGPGTLAFDGTTLTFTSDGTGQMGNLCFEVGAIDDTLVEGNEDFQVSIANPGTTTGADIMTSGPTVVNTTIVDNDDSTWSITGDPTVAEGANAKYVVSLAGTLQAGETATIELHIGNVDTTLPDYANFAAAVNTAISNYTGPGTLAFDGTTLTFTSDGTGPMGDLCFEVGAIDDTLVEGNEDFQVSIANPGTTTGSSVMTAGSTVVTTTIIDNDDSTWSITGDPTVAEGANAKYVVSLAGTLQAGETASIELHIGNVTAIAPDYGNLATAVNTAISNYSGPGTLTFDGTTLTFTSDGTGPMGDLCFEVGAVDDPLVEGNEDFQISIANPGTTTGSSVITAGSTVVTTTIIDNDDSTWSITGDPTVAEGANAKYLVSLAGTLQAGETATIELHIGNVDTTLPDYANFVAAVNTAISNYTGPGAFAFDGTTLTFTSDGNQMSDLCIELNAIDDTSVEGSEDYRVSIANPGTTTGSATVTGGTTIVTTTIIDNDVVTWSITGDTTVGEGANAKYTVGLDGTLQAGETATIELHIGNVTANLADVANFQAAVNAAISNYTGPGAFAFDGTTLTFTSDGNPMGDLCIELNTIDDTSVEGSEDYRVSIANPGTTTGSDVVTGGPTVVTTTIFDNEIATWSIAGDSSVGEGANAKYTVNLAGALQAGQTASIELAIGNTDTTSADYANFVAAVNAAISNYTGPGALTFDGTTLTFTSDGNPMGDLCIELTAIDDTAVEGNEDYTVSIANAGTTTGSPVATAGPTTVTTTITDNDPAIWSITGDATVGEGASAEYKVSLAGTLQAGETATIELHIGNVNAILADYGSLVPGVNAAIASYTGPGSFSYDGTTLTFTSDGNPMGDLCFEVPAIDDALIEGNEDYRVSIANPGTTTGSGVVTGGSTVVTTTITDNDIATWSITGDATVSEGDDAKYIVNLAGALQAGETATIELAIGNVDTTSTDYANFVAAVNTAISNYAGPGSFAFDGTTLTFTSDGNPMGDLCIELTATDDALSEGSEDYTVGISNPGSTTGSGTNAAASLVMTTIQDNDSVQWSIMGDVVVDEGGTAQYIVSLSGILQAGENSSVELTLADIDTTSADYDVFITAVQAAVASRSDLAFDSTTGTLTATGTGAMMADLIIDVDAIDDNLIEGAERYQVLLSNSSSTTGSATGIDPAKDIVTTTIRDTVGDGGVLEAAFWSIGVDQTVPEGNQAAYVLNLAGNLQAGEVVTVDVKLTDVDTVGADHGSLSSALILAVANYSGPGSVAWDGTTLTFTSDGTGPMDPMPLTLGTVNDAFAEGAEDFLISLCNSNTLTGAANAINQTADDVVTTIDDTIGPGADDVTWSIVGDNNVDEGGTATYTVSMINALAAGDDATVELSIGDIDTNSTDYAGFNTAVVAAVANYNAGGNPGTLSWDGTTLTFTAATDGDLLTGLVINLDAIDDAFLEGPEVYDVTLANSGSNTGIVVVVDPISNTVLTTINDTDGDGGPAEQGGEWSLIGLTSVTEGDPITFTVGLTGNLQAGESTTVQFNVVDVETSGADYSSVSASLGAAVAAYTANSANPGSLTWDGTFLTFVSDGTGPMNDLNVTYSSIDDLLVEGNERLGLVLSNPSSLTGLSPTLSPTNSVVTTTIVDNDVSEWSISGPAVTAEGGTADYTISLDGVFQAGEVVTVDLGIADIDTTSGDYGSFVAAVTAAAAANPDLNFDPITGQLTYTAPADGAMMTDLIVQLPISSDGISEAPEDFIVTLANPSSSTGLSPTIDPSADDVVTTINGSPVTNSDNYFTNIDTPFVGNVVDNDSDPDGDVLTVTQVDGQPIGTPIVTDCGTVVMNPNGSFTFTPFPGFSGVDTFEYTVVDEFGNEQIETVTITISEARIGSAKSVSDAVPNGDNWNLTFTIVVENLGNAPLNNLTVLDDVAARFGSALVATGAPTVQNFSGSGAAPTINSQWVGDTSQNMINGGVLQTGDSFEVVFSITVDPDASGTASDLGNQATVSGDGINPDGSPMIDGNGDPVTATDDSDNGTDPEGENGNEDSVDGISGNDVTGISIADLGIAKSIVGEPVLTDFGNYVVTYQIVVENTGTVDLASLSLLEDLTTQFGSAFVNAGNLNLVTPPGDAGSSIDINSAAWNGSSQIELMDIAASNLLVSGDSFAIEFDVEIDPRQVATSLGNQVEGSATAVGAGGAPLLDSNGNPLVANDLSDAGTDPGSSNPDDPSDTGSSDDVSEFVPPEVPLGEISGVVFLDDNGNGVQDSGEGGIQGVEITLTGEDVFGNPVEVVVFTDASGRYTFSGLNAGNYAITQTQPDGFTDGLDVGESSWTVANDRFSNISLGWGDAFDTSSFAERSSGASGNPPRLPALPPMSNFVSNLLSNYLGGPGPIYSGVPIFSNANPLSLDSGGSVMGGYWTGDDLDPCACECPEVADPCGSIDSIGGLEDPCEMLVDPCGDMNGLDGVMIDAGPCGEIIDESNCESVVPTEVEGTLDLSELPGENATVEESVSEELADGEASQISFQERSDLDPSFLKRCRNWLSM